MPKLTDKEMLSNQIVFADIRERPYSEEELDTAIALQALQDEIARALLNK